MTKTTYRVHAPFMVNGSWRWDTFDTTEANTHAAIINHAAEIGAKAWDTSQASEMDVTRGTVLSGHPTVFR